MSHADNKSQPAVLGEDEKSADRERDDVLRRMLKTPHKRHVSLKDADKTERRHPEPSSD